MINTQTWKSGSKFDAFHALETDKQHRIIEAALAEFAAKGFKRASTNTIAENAKIGKGMLFYYFGSKEELFDFLCEYAIEFMRNKYLQKFETDSTDFLKMQITLTEIKRDSMNDCSGIIAFFESFYREENAPYFEKFAAEISEIKKQLYTKIYKKIDYSLFRSDLEGSTVAKYIKWLLAAFETDITERVKRGEIDLRDEQSISGEWAKFYSFTDDLRKIFYRENNSDGNN